MNRRDFVKYSLLTAGGVAGLGLRANHSLAQVSAAGGRTLIHVMLLGGADLRYLFVPDPKSSPEYAAAFWEARRSIYQYNAANTQLYPTYEAVFSALYRPVTDPASELSFGIHNNAGFLAAQFAAGNVAIVANVLGSDNRRHDQSQLIVQTGDSLASQYVYDREGWGGRLAYAIAKATGAANAVAVTKDIAIFCNGTDAANRNARVVHAPDTRDFGLSPGDADPVSAGTVTARALRAYYAQKGIEVKQRLDARQQPADWPFRKFLQHEASLRSFGDAFNARVAPVAQPASLAALFTAGSGNTLSSTDFGLQCANVYDSFLGADLFQQRIVSMEYTGWDTHNNEKPRFEANIQDIFGAGKGLATLTDELESRGTGATEDIVYVFNTDFGRQLRANGDWGTDHGRGNYSIVLGRGVNGGTHGEMFPASEIQGAAGATAFDQRGADIQGRTSLERVLAQVCDWVEPGTGGKVFSDTATRLSPVENGVDFDASPIFT